MPRRVLAVSGALAEVLAALDAPMPVAPRDDTPVVSRQTARRATARPTRAPKPAARRAPAAGKLDPATFRTLLDDSGLTFQYGTGEAKLYGPRDVEGAAADFAERVATLPKDLAAAGAKRLSDGPAMSVRVPAYQDAGARRLLQASDLHRYATSSEASCTRVLGQTLGDHWAMRQTDGHAGLLTPAARASTVHTLRLKTGPEAPVRFITTPEFWRAYSRVRTCRHERSGAVQMTVGPDGVTVRTEQAGDWSACETVPNAGTSAEPYAITLADGYVWPLRGAFAEFRQFTPNDPVFVAGLHECAVVIMPMRI